MVTPLRPSKRHRQPGLQPGQQATHRVGARRGADGQCVAQRRVDHVGVCLRRARRCAGAAAARCSGHRRPDAGSAPRSASCAASHRAARSRSRCATRGDARQRARAHRARRSSRSGNRRQPASGPRPTRSGDRRAAAPARRRARDTHRATRRHHASAFAVDHARVRAAALCEAPAREAQVCVDPRQGQQVAQWRRPPDSWHAAGAARCERFADQPWRQSTGSPTSNSARRSCGASRARRSWVGPSPTPDAHNVSSVSSPRDVAGPREDAVHAPAEIVARHQVADRVDGDGQAPRERATPAAHPGTGASLPRQPAALTGRAWPQVES